MAYVDGFILAVPKTSIADYEGFARRTGAIWMEHGAHTYVECVGDDVPYGDLTSFPREVMAKDDEVVVFAWITYESRAHRDAVVAKVMADPRTTIEGEGMKLIDGARMIYGGFTTLFEL